MAASGTGGTDTSEAITTACIDSISSLNVCDTDEQNGQAETVGGASAALTMISNARGTVLEAGCITILQIEFLAWRGMAAAGS